MKKAVVLLFAAICFYSVSFAQEDTTMNRPPAGMQKMKKPFIKNDGGKILVVKEGTKTVLDQDMTLSNGTVVSKDGTVTLKDGTKRQLNDGEAIDMEGNTLPNRKDKPHMQ